jgi:hypothetical protein
MCGEDQVPRVAERQPRQHVLSAWPSLADRGRPNRHGVVSVLWVTADHSGASGSFGPLALKTGGLAPGWVGPAVNSPSAGPRLPR